MLNSLKKFLEESSSKKITLEEDFYILNEFLISPKDFDLEEEDKKIIKKWNLSEIENDKRLKKFLKSNQEKANKNKINNLDYQNKIFQETIEKKKLCLNILEETLAIVKTTIQEVINKNENYQPSILKEFTSIKNKIEKILKINEDLLIFHTNIFVDKNKLDELLTKNIIYGLIVGIKLNIKKDLLETLFVSILLSEVFYFTKNPQALNQSVMVKNLNFQFLKEHISVAYKKFKKNTNISNSIKNIIFLHHEHLDGSGILGLEKEKINPLIHILTTIQEFFYLTTDFLGNIFQSISPYKATLLFLKNQKKYHEKYLKVFLSLNPLYPLGEVIVLMNKEMAIITGKSKNYKLPVVEIISGEDLNSVIDLSEMPEENLIYSALEDTSLKNKLIEDYKNKKNKKKSFG